MFELKLPGGEAIKNRLGVEAGVEERRVTRDFVPDEITIHGQAIACRCKDAQFMPGGQIFWRRQPTAGDALKLRGVQADQWREGGKIYWQRTLAGGFERRKFGFRNACQIGRASCRER